MRSGHVRTEAEASQKSRKWWNIARAARTYDDWCPRAPSRKGTFRGSASLRQQEVP